MGKMDEMDTMDGMDEMDSMQRNVQIVFHLFTFPLMTYVT